jgi:histidine ammonia-lyase
MRVVSGHLLGHQEWGDPMRVASGDTGSQEGVIVTSHMLGNGDVLDTTCFKAMMAIKISELYS